MWERQVKIDGSNFEEQNADKKQDQQHAKSQAANFEGEMCQEDKKEEENISKKVYLERKTEKEKDTKVEQQTITEMTKWESRNGHDEEEVDAGSEMMSKRQAENDNPKTEIEKTTKIQSGRRWKAQVRLMDAQPNLPEEDSKEKAAYGKKRNDSRESNGEEQNTEDKKAGKKQCLPYENRTEAKNGCSEKR